MFYLRTSVCIVIILLFYFLSIHLFVFFKKYFFTYKKTLKIQECTFKVFGDPYGNRTHDSTLRGWRLNRLTKGPINTLYLYHIFVLLVNRYLWIFYFLKENRRCRNICGFLVPYRIPFSTLDVLYLGYVMYVWVVSPEWCRFTCLPTWSSSPYQNRPKCSGALLPLEPLLVITIGAETHQKEISFPSASRLTVMYICRTLLNGWLFSIATTVAS